MLIAGLTLSWFLLKAAAINRRIEATSFDLFRHTLQFRRATATRPNAARLPPAANYARQARNRSVRIIYCARNMSIRRATFIDGTCIPPLSFDGRYYLLASPLIIYATLTTTCRLSHGRLLKHRHASFHYYSQCITGRGRHTGHL